MSMATVIAIQDAIRRSFENEEVQRLAHMIAQHRHDSDVTDEMYEEGIGMLVSMAAAAVTAEVSEVIIPKDEYEAMVNEYREFTVQFKTEEEE